jgi:membrane-bound ClpP family serine protease
VEYGSANTNTQDYTEPYPSSPIEQQEPAALAIVSLVLGVISLLLSFTFINIVTGIISIILGAIHLSKRKTKRGLAITGIALSIVSIVLLIIIIVIGVAVLSSNPDIYDVIFN